MNAIVDKNQVWREWMNRHLTAKALQLIRTGDRNKYNQIQPQNEVEILVFCELIDHWNDLQGLACVSSVPGKY